MLTVRIPLLAVLLLVAGSASATIFGSVSGLIHDPQHRPVQGAQVTLRSTTSDWNKSAASDDSGEFHFDSVPLGDYRITVELAGFATQAQDLALISGRDARLHFSLTIAQTKETVEVKDTGAAINSESSTTQSVISRQQIASTPGADQTNSLAMITDYVPGAYMVHDQLHIRGGHQVSWLLDGVPVPNTSIASNVGPQFDPKDIDYLEVQRGGYSAEYGDRTYGVFNVVTRSGFERNRQAELVANYGSFNSTNDQLSFGDHGERFAYYGSLSGYRTDLGLETPSSQVLNDQAAGLGGFASFIFNKTPADQLRLVTSLRGDHYQIPNTPAQLSSGIRDVQNERDAFVNFSWLHTIGSGTVLTVSAFYHFNRVHYSGSSVGQPDPNLTIPEDDRGSNYLGGVTSIAIRRGKHNAHAGIQLWAARDNQLFATVQGDGSNPQSQRQRIRGNVQTLFLEDQYKLTSWFTLNAGIRLTHFGETTVSENSADPRVGAAIRIPKLNWVARAFYGRYYQAPPLLTVSGSLLGFDLAPLRGERDDQREFGLAIPIAGWTLDLSNFRTGARNFFDHDALENNIFIPLTIGHARIRGTEVSVNSPRIAKRANAHLVHSNLTVQGACPITGGCISTCGKQGYFLLDHDQRNTLAAGVNLVLPWHAWADLNLKYGSGFLNGEGDEEPTHLPPHTTFDLSLGKSFGENWNVRLTGLNLSNHHYLLDNANSFGGTHFANPRELSIQLKYRFR